MFRSLIDNNTLQDGAYALLAAIAFMLVLQVLLKLALRNLGRVARSTNTVIDDFFVDIMSARRSLFVVVTGLFLGTHFLTLPANLEKFVDRVFIAIVIFQMGVWVNRGIIFWLRHRFSQGGKEDEGARAMTMSLLSFLGRVVLWAVVLLLMLDNLGINVTALVTSLGIGGIAVALAVQNILGDLFAALAIAIDKPFVVGDFIVVGDILGSVEHVGLKTTRIRSLDGEQIILSNNDLLNSRIHNFKRMKERRAVFGIGVTYDTPMEKLELVAPLIRQAIEAQDDVRVDRVHFKKLGDFALEFEAVYYVLKPEYGALMDVQQGINMQLVRSFAQQSIEFAFPTQTVHLEPANGAELEAG